MVHQNNVVVRSQPSSGPRNLDPTRSWNKQNFGLLVTDGSTDKHRQAHGTDLTQQEHNGTTLRARGQVKP